MAQDDYTPKKKKVNRKRRGGTTVALTRIAHRALQVSDDDIRLYAPREIDLRIAECLVTAPVRLSTFSFKTIGEDIGVSGQTISNALKDPVACAYIFRLVEGALRNAIGAVGVTLAMRAMTGDTRAADTFLRHFKTPQAQRHLSINATLPFDVTTLTDQDLDALLRNAQNSGGTPE